MNNPIPPLNPLRTFEAAARLSSLTHAAQELNVSQVAVSRKSRCWKIIWVWCCSSGYTAVSS